MRCQVGEFLQLGVRLGQQGQGRANLLRLASEVRIQRQTNVQQQQLHQRQRGRDILFVAALIHLGQVSEPVLKVEIVGPQKPFRLQTCVGMGPADAEPIRHISGSQPGLEHVCEVRLLRLFQVSYQARVAQK